ncbi:MAG: hypothetical protein HQL99_04820 [Magnetococcales bacterium]|nr:hypothetical protein [Magnetococcales bacterium]
MIIPVSFIDMKKMEFVVIFPRLLRRDGECVLRFAMNGRGRDRGFFDQLFDKEYLLRMEHPVQTLFVSNGKPRVCVP